VPARYATAPKEYCWVIATSSVPRMMNNRIAR
jgi:hypothetical protein